MGWTRISRMALSESGDSMPRDHIYLCCGIDPSSYYNLRVVLRLGIHRTVHQPLIKFLPWSEAHINYTGNVSGDLSDLLWTVILLVYCNWVVNQEELSTTGRRFFHLFWSLKKLSEISMKSLGWQWWNFCATHDEWWKRFQLRVYLRFGRKSKVGSCPCRGRLWDTSENQC